MILPMIKNDHEETANTESPPVVADWLYIFALMIHEVLLEEYPILVKENQSTEYRSEKPTLEYSDDRTFKSKTPEADGGADTRSPEA